MLFVNLNAGIHIQEIKKLVYKDGRYNRRLKISNFVVRLLLTEQYILKYNLSGKFSILHSSILFLNPHRRGGVCVCLCVQWLSEVCMENHYQGLS